MLLCERDHIFPPRHPTRYVIGLDQLADTAGRSQSGQQTEINRGFGMASTLYHSPSGIPKRKDVPGSDEGRGDSGGIG